MDIENSGQIARAFGIVSESSRETSKLSQAYVFGSLHDRAIYGKQCTNTPPLASEQTTQLSPPILPQSNLIKTLLQTNSLLGGQDADTVAKLLSVLSGKYDVYTRPVQHTAPDNNFHEGNSEQRLLAVQLAHAGSSYIQDSIHTRTQLLQDEMSTGMQLFQDEMRTGMQIFHDELHSHLVDVEDRLATVFTLLEAQNYNARVVGRNAWVVTSDIGSLTPLRKTLRGDGSSRANELITGSQTIGSALINPPPVVGDVPTAWNENLASYNHRDIHHLIVFYNDDFGIVKEDDLAT